MAGASSNSAQSYNIIDKIIPPKFRVKQQMKVKIKYLILIMIALSVYVVIGIEKKNMLIWLPDYISWELKNLFEENNVSPKHIMLILVDHHEHKYLDNEIKWLKRWEKLANKHIDSDGEKVQYTFAFPYDFFLTDAANAKQKLKAIANTCANGYGDIELHYHFSNETSDSFRHNLRMAKQLFGEVGALITIDNKEAFGFVHGNWALDNSIITNDGRNYSGVNNELDILREEGCYADFTFPAFGTKAQPSIINSIYYALDDTEKPKSYDTGILVEAGKKKSNDKYFMIFQGLIIIRPFVNSKLLYIERSNIQVSELPSPTRADNWIKNGIKLKGKPDWIFVKLHMHGAHHPEAVLGKEMDQTLSYLENHYNDAKKYVLHYVTSREGYNIVKAAEAGLQGNPNIYRDYLIKPYKYNTLK